MKKDKKEDRKTEDYPLKEGTKTFLPTLYLKEDKETEESCLTEDVGSLLTINFLTSSRSKTSLTRTHPGRIVKMILKNNKGFSLIEITVVLVVLAIVVGFAVAKYTDFLPTVRASGGLNTAVTALNNYENLNWNKYLLDNGGAYNDVTNFASLSYIPGPDVECGLGNDYNWEGVGDPVITGGTLTYQGEPSGGEALVRTAGTNTSPPKWARP